MKVASMIWAIIVVFGPVVLGLFCVFVLGDVFAPELDHFFLPKRFPKPHGRVDQENTDKE